MDKKCLCNNCSLNGCDDCPIIKLKQALKEIYALDLGGVDCENPKHWQAHQFHKARKIALKAIQ